MGHRIMTALVAVALLATSATAHAEPDRGRKPARRASPVTNPMAAAMARAEEARAQAVPTPDLFPQALLEAYAARRPMLPPPARKKFEPRDVPAIPLGDDRDWRVQAAQIAGMTGAFAALAVLCADGGCKL